MRLSDLFNEENVVTDMPAGSKEDVLRAIVNDLASKGHIRDVEKVAADVIEREKVMSTGIGNGVAIPHAYTDGVEQLVAGFYRSSGDIDFEALDKKAVNLFFVILGPKESRRDHIKVLAKISRLLNHEDFRQFLRDATDPADVIGVFKRFGDR